MSDNQPPPYGNEPEGGGTPDPYGQPPSYGQQPNYGQQPGYGDQGAYGAQQPGYGQQPPYGAPPAAGAGRSTLAIASLILGIIGIPCCGCFVFNIAAIVTGFLAKKEIRESNGAKEGAGLAQWGLILGIVGLVFAVVSTILQLTGVVDSGIDFQNDFS